MSKLDVGDPTKLSQHELLQLKRNIARAEDAARDARQGKAPTGQTTAQFLAGCRAELRALGVELPSMRRDVATPAIRKDVQSPAARKDVHGSAPASLNKSSDGPAPPQLRAHPEYKKAHDAAVALRARDRGWHDGLDEMSALESASRRRGEGDPR